MSSRSRRGNPSDTKATEGRRRGGAVKANTAAPRQRDLKTTLCMTCFEKVDPAFNEDTRVWEFWNSDTLTPHKCKGSDNEKA